MNGPTPIKIIPTKRYTREEALGAVNWGLYGKFRARQDCVRRALAQPLPGPAKGAFLNRAIQVGDKSIHRITPYLWKVIVALDSPMVKLLEQTGKPDKDGKTTIACDWEPEQTWDLCFVFSMSPDALESAFESQSIEQFKKTARRLVGHDWDAHEIDLVFAAIMEQFARHIETKVKVFNDLKDKGDISFFREPKEIMTQKMSAGS
jgi:hypothetical protein